MGDEVGDGLFETDGGVAVHLCPVFPLPFGRRHSLLGHRVPAEGSASSQSAHLPATLPDLDGVPTFHTSEMRLGWAPHTPGTVVSSRLKARYSTGTCRFPAASPLHPAGTSHRRDSSVTRHRRVFTRVHPSGLPLACDPRMERGSLGFLPELRTPPFPATHVRMGTFHGHWHRTTPWTSVEPPIGAFTHLVRSRVAPSRRPVRCAVLPGHPTLSDAPPASPTAQSSHLAYRHRPFTRS
jgi:hypothetical protein